MLKIDDRNIGVIASAIVPVFLSSTLDVEAAQKAVFALLKTEYKNIPSAFREIAL